MTKILDRNLITVPAASLMPPLQFSPKSAKTNAFLVKIIYSFHILIFQTFDEYIVLFSFNIVCCIWT